VRGRLVYAGGGVSAPGLPEDAYAHADLTDALVLVEAEWPGLSGMRADPHFRATVAQGRGAAGLVLLLPEDRELPLTEDEVRPFVRIPVAAATGEAARSLREAAREGASGRLSVEVRPR